MILYDFSIIIIILITKITVQTNAPTGITCNNSKDKVEVLVAQLPLCQMEDSPLSKFPQK